MDTETYPAKVSKVYSEREKQYEVTFPDCKSKIYVFSQHIWIPAAFIQQQYVMDNPDKCLDRFIMIIIVYPHEYEGDMGNQLPD